MEGRDTWEWPPITLPACLPPLSPGLTLHAPFVVGDKIVPIIQGWGGEGGRVSLSVAGSSDKVFFYEVVHSTVSKKSIQDLGSHRPQGPSIIIMGGLGSLWLLVLRQILSRHAGRARHRRASGHVGK